MNFKNFIVEIAEDWRKLNRNKIYGLAGAASPIIGESAEVSMLRKLRLKFPKYEFQKTINSRTPADIIGLRKQSKYWHFALFQVKASLNKSNLKKKIPEKKTLPALADIIKDRFVTSIETKNVKKRPLFITIGYIGVLSTKTKVKNKYSNKMILSSPYSKTFSLNKLNMSSTEKTDLKNLIHKI